MLKCRDLKKGFLFIIVIVAAAGRSFAADGISFIAIGDWGRQGSENQTAVAEQMSVWAMDNKANFVISLGDNFYENGVTSTGDPLWRVSFEDVYTSQYLQIPWYAALGNHDYHGNVQAQIDYSKSSSRWKMPARFYAFTEKLDDGSTVLFVIMDTSPISRSDDESKTLFSEDITKIDNNIQYNWMDSVLTHTDAKWKIVCGHHPVISGGYHGGQVEMQQEVEPVFVKDKVDAYICGHDHDMQHLKRKGINYFVSGAGSEPRNCEDTNYTYFFAPKTPGFLGIHLSSGELRASFTDKSGNELYTTSITK